MRFPHCLSSEASAFELTHNRSNPIQNVGGDERTSGFVKRRIRGMACRNAGRDRGTGSFLLWTAKTWRVVNPTCEQRFYSGKYITLSINTLQRPIVRDGSMNISNRDDVFLSFSATRETRCALTTCRFRCVGCNKRK